MAVQPGFYQTWTKTPKTGFLRTRLIYFQLVCACIIPKQGTNLTAEDIREYYKSKYLANATEAFGGWTAGSGLAPRMILLFDDFPRLYNDKPDKKKLIDEAMRRKSQMSL